MRVYLTYFRSDGEFMQRTDFNSEDKNFEETIKEIRRLAGERRMLPDLMQGYHEFDILVGAQDHLPHLIRRQSK